METADEFAELLDSIQDLHSVMSMRNAVINTPQGQSITVSTGSNINGILGGTTTGTTYVTPSYIMHGGVYGTIEEIDPPVVPENVIDELTLMIASLEKDEDEQMQKAVKHLTFAKAYLEKMVLDKLNQKL